MSGKSFLDKLAKNIIITGHYGSGKTNIAVNLALALKKTGADVTLIDLDTVNPYFRAADAKELLQSSGIKCVIPEYANTNVDIPSLPREIGSAFLQNEKTHSYTIFDVGGDNGAVALGAYSTRLKESGYDMLYVTNKFRPLTSTASDSAGILREIEQYSRLTHTALLNNSNIGHLTTKEDIINSLDYAKELSEISGLPLFFTSYTDKLSEFATEDFCAEKHKTEFFSLKNVTKKLF